jgi:hypothetical protein
MSRLPTWPEWFGQVGPLNLSQSVLLHRAFLDTLSESRFSSGVPRNSYPWIAQEQGWLKLWVPVADDLHMDPSAIALQGLQQADAQLEAAATKIANAGATSPDGIPLDTVDLRVEMVALMAAQNLFEANIATIKTTDQMRKALIDIKT